MGFRYNHSSDGTIIRHQDEMKMKIENNLNYFLQRKIAINIVNKRLYKMPYIINIH